MLAPSPSKCNSLNTDLACQALPGSTHTVYFLSPTQSRPYSPSDRAIFQTALFEPSNSNFILPLSQVSNTTSRVSPSGIWNSKAVSRKATVFFAFRVADEPFSIPFNCRNIVSVRGSEGRVISKRNTRPFRSNRIKRGIRSTRKAIMKEVSLPIHHCSPDIFPFSTAPFHRHTT